jgi:hypothetical protein
MASPTRLRAAGQATPVPTPPPTPPSLAALKATAGAPQVAFFRALLSADLARRQQMLANVPDEHRQVLTNSVRAYQALPTNERELRLRTMELRFQITSLLRQPPSARAEILNLIPAESRQAVSERLAIWDQLPPDVQKALLDQERLLRFVTVVRVSPPRPPGLETASTAFSGPVTQAAAGWHSLPEAKRRQAEDAFNRVFELGPKEVDKVIGPLPLSASEREAMEESLAQFRKMSVEQRSLCIRNFKRFADLPGAERVAYLRGAEEWRKMSPEDRSAWRQMVKAAPQFPPMPPGIYQPPLPPGSAARRIPAGFETATNSQGFPRP